MSGRITVNGGRLFLFAAGFIFMGGVKVGHANERHFTYAYESGVLAPGTREVELWSTYRTGREEYYARFDHRAEFEVGLTNRLMTAFYLNWRDVSQQDNSTNPASIKKEFEWEGISSEWKYKMTDPVADALGSALYTEFSLGTDELGVEGKVILDKRLGKNLFAYNFVVEPEWVRQAEGGYGAPEVGLENDLAFTHFIKPNFGTGLELQNKIKFTHENRPAYNALFLGPVVSYATDNWWVAFTALAQLPALKPSVADPHSNLVLDDQERYQARILFSFHI